MLGRSSFDASKTTASPKGVTALLFGLIVCYQVVTQIFLHRAVNDEDRDFELDGACSAMAGGPSGVSCMEAKLFQGWHELPADSLAELDQVLKVAYPSEQPSATTIQSPLAPAIEESSGTQAPRADTNVELNFLGELVLGTSHKTVGLGGNSKLEVDSHGDIKLEVHKDTMTASSSAEIKPDGGTAFAMGGGDKSHEAPGKHPHEKPVTRAARAHHAALQANHRPTPNPAHFPAHHHTHQPAHHPANRPAPDHAANPAIHPALHPASDPAHHPAQHFARHLAQHPTPRPPHRPGHGPGHLPGHHPARNPAFEEQEDLRSEAPVKSPLETVAKRLTDLQQKLEAKMQAQVERHAEHRALRVLSVAALGQSKEGEVTNDPMTLWAQHVNDLTHEEEDQMKAWQKEHASADAKKTKAASDDVKIPSAQHLDDLQHEMQENVEHLKQHMHARLAALHTGEGIEKTRTPFLNEIDTFGRELCQDAERRKRMAWACNQFVHRHASAAGGHEDESKVSQDPGEHVMTHIKLLEKHLHGLESDHEHDNKEIQKESIGFLKELCADPARHSYPACARVLVPSTTTIMRKLARAFSQPNALTRGPETEDANKPHHVDSGPLVMQKEELSEGHWGKRIPSVACVTVLPEGQVTETLMRSFMDNYKLQHYEGKHELILVYSSADKEADRIVERYADGTSIKAAVARGGKDYFGATAFRYGAWIARHSHLVVRWDFEAWHHPNRISMQVRAMAISKRPASLVTRVTAFDNDGKRATVAGGNGPHGSMMGKAEWMRKHWMPLMEEELTVLHLHSSEVAQVAMPELLSYHDVSMLSVA